MSKGNKLLPESTPELHLRYIRLPSQVLNLYDELIYKSEKVVIGKSVITSTHSVIFDGETVLTSGFLRIMLNA